MKTSYSSMKSVVLTLLCVFALSPQLKAQTASIDGITYEVKTASDGSKYAETAKIDGGYTLETITISATVKIEGTDYAVKKIGDNSMRENPNLKSVSLPEGLEVIGNSSFAQCPVLPEVVLPSTVKSIEDWAFYGCPLLTKINIPDGVTAITDHTLQETGLTSIVLPASVKTLGVCAFQTCKNLSSINLENVTEIKAWALGGTALKSVEIKNIKFINSSIFYECPELESVILGSAIQTGEWTFKGCTKLKDVSLPNSLESIDGGAFSGCSSLKSITIPSAVAFLGAWAFEKTGITEIYASWADPDDVITDESIFGEDDGKINFVWKVPEEVRSAYGDEFLGYPVQVGNSVANEYIQVNDANVFYANGSLTISNLDGYSAWVYSLDGHLVSGFNVNGNICNLSLSLQSGVYIIKAQKGSSISTAKFYVK